MMAAPAAAQARQIMVTAVDCQRLLAHIPSPDVAYKPGVDAYGRPVTPADLPSGDRVKPPETFTIDIEVDLQERFGIPRNSELFEGDVQLGSVEVMADGKAFYNGQSLQDPEQEALADYCRERLGL
jgi:hypothetical protein